MARTISNRKPRTMKRYISFICSLHVRPTLLQWLAQMCFGSFSRRINRDLVSFPSSSLGFDYRYTVWKRVKQSGNSIMEFAHFKYQFGFRCFEMTGQPRSLVTDFRTSRRIWNDTESRIERSASADDISRMKRMTGLRTIIHLGQHQYLHGSSPGTRLQEHAAL